MPDVEAELRSRAESDGVEFFFAMFVDMHGKPCAKMIPATALDVLLGGAGFAVGGCCLGGGATCGGGQRSTLSWTTREPRTIGFS